LARIQTTIFAGDEKKGHAFPVAVTLQGKVIMPQGVFKLPENGTIVRLSGLTSSAHWHPWHGKVFSSQALHGRFLVS